MGPALAAELAQMGAELQELHQASQKLQLEFQRKAAQQTLMMSSTAPAQQQAAAGGAQGGAPPPVNNVRWRAFLADVPHEALPSLALSTTF